MPSRSKAGRRLCGSKPPGAPLLVAHLFGGDHALSPPAPADAAHPLLAAEDLILDQEALLAVLVDDELWRPVAEGRVHIVIPERHRLQDMAIGSDDVVRTGHYLSPLAQL